MTYELIQSALTAATEIIAIAGLTGIITHGLWTSHKNWMTEHCPPIPHATTAPEITTESPQSETLEGLFKQAEQIISEPIYADVEPEESSIPKEIVFVVVEKPVKPRKAKVPKKLQPTSLGAAALDYRAMSSEQLRKECALQNINWRTGGDRHKPMRKIEMLAALGHFQD